MKTKHLLIALGAAMAAHGLGAAESCITKVGETDVSSASLEEVASRLEMHGNAWEWCLDWYEDDITTRGGAVNVDTTNSANTLSGTAGTLRVLRGGCWAFSAERERAAFRDGRVPGNSRGAGTGFRLALSAGL